MVSFVPLNTRAFRTPNAKFRTAAASLLKLTRNTGGSVGISLMTALFAPYAQVSHPDYIQHITLASAD